MSAHHLHPDYFPVAELIGNEASIFESGFAFRSYTTRKPQLPGRTRRPSGERVRYKRGERGEAKRCPVVACADPAPPDTHNQHPARVDRTPDLVMTEARTSPPTPRSRTLGRRGPRRESPGLVIKPGDPATCRRPARRPRFPDHGTDANQSYASAGVSGSRASAASISASENSGSSSLPARKAS
jgi:hypothetical protein